MTLLELMASIAPTGLNDVAFPQHLLGAFRRKSITFANGLTDETTAVYWFQSRSFTIDLRLPDGAATGVTERQGWVGDTLWDHDSQQLSWHTATSYQPRNQWPEPARLHFIGNSVIEFAPSGAYVEDWRQQASTGPFLGLRLVARIDDATGERLAMDGGLVLAGAHAAFACSRRPELDARWQDLADLDQALLDKRVTRGEIESYEVSVAMDGAAITHTTQPWRMGQALLAGDFRIDRDGSIILDASGHSLCFDLDVYVPDFAFGQRTEVTTDALAWQEREKAHLFRNARPIR